MRALLTRSVLLILALAAGACATDPAPDAGPPPAEPRSASGDTVDVRGVSAARARLEGDVSGMVRLRQLDGGVRVQVEVSGLNRDELFGLQILSSRSCDDVDPSMHLGDGRSRHGAYDAPPRRRHTGDLGNLRSDDRGVARYDRIDPVITMTGYLSPVGRAIVVREKQDDAWTGADGGAGSVLVCGILEPAR